MSKLTEKEVNNYMMKLMHDQMYLDMKKRCLEKKLKALEEEKKELNEKIWKTKVELHKLKNTN